MAVKFFIRNRQVPNADEFVSDIESTLFKGVEDWLIDLEDDLLGNTGAIWPYDTGRSSQGFELIKKNPQEYHFENDEDYAVALEERGGYIVRLLEENDSKLEEAMREAVRGI